MKAHTKTMEDALKEGVFDIPAYQRSFSWGEEQRREFLQDIRYLPVENNHFFGNIILDEQPDRYVSESGIKTKAYDVVDGQQRLTTVILFLRVASELDERVREQLELSNSLFVPGDRPRLLPQDQDRQFFEDNLLGDANHAPETPSQERLQRTYQYFHEELTRIADEDGIPVREMADRLRHNFKINIVETEGESEAAFIFEGLNDRGKPLSSLEKTKSLLVSMDGRANRDGEFNENIDRRFGEIYRKLFVLSDGHHRSRDFDEDAFQRFHWGMYDGYESNEYFNSFETLKRRLYQRYRSEDYEGVCEEIERYSLRLREAAGAFETLFRPERHSSTIREPLFKLLELGRLTNVVPILMAAFLKYGDDRPQQMRAIIDQCETLVFRVYSIDRRRSNTGRSKLVDLANAIHSDPSHGIDDTLDRLAEITRTYADDDRFEQALTNRVFYKNVPSRDIRYLLYHYGQHLEENSEETQPPLEEILGQNFHVEHILSRKLPDDEIPEDIDDFTEYVNRLGNLTIANQYWNTEYGNLPFEAKKEADSDREVAYANSNLRVQRALADYDEFTGATLEAREREIVEFALDNWTLEDEPELSLTA